MIPLPNADVIFNLLARLVDGPGPDALLFLGEALEDAGRLDLKHILAGSCPECGGEMRATKEINAAGDHRREKYHRCRKCREIDVDYAEPSLAPNYLWDARYRRVCRLLRVRECPGPAHDWPMHPHVWRGNPECFRCKGRGIIP